MKVVIRHPETRLYRRKDGSWIKDWTKAQHFDDSFEGVKFCIAENLEAYQVLLKHATNESYDVIVLEHSAHNGSSNGDGRGDSRTHLFTPRRPMQE